MLGRIARAHELDHELRTALRLRMRALVDRLKVEQAKQRIVEGNFAAARYHLTVPREWAWKLRLALVALQEPPRLMRAAYLRMRPSLWKNQAVAAR